jgi:ankyrin repeat protein
MKSQLIAIAAAVLVVGCGAMRYSDPLAWKIFRTTSTIRSQQSAPAPEAKPKPPTAKAPDISIHEAAMQRNLEAVKQHIAAGADVNAKDVNGYTPLDWAIFNKDTETAALIRKHGGKTGEELKAEGN